MFQKIKNLLVKHKEIIVYMLFGALTTVVDFMVYWPLDYICHWPATVCNAASWVASVAFAFLTNKPFVFRSNDWSAKVLFPELGKFVGCRLISFLIAEAFLFITVDWLGWHSLLMKGLITVVVVILNYIASKLLVFRKKRRG